MDQLKKFYNGRKNRSDPETKKVVQIAWPVLIEVLLSSLFGMVDMMMLGNIPGRELANQSVAAVGIVNQPLYVGIALVQALNVGGTAIIARYLGAQKQQDIEQVLKHVILISFAGLTIPTFLVCQLFAPQIMGLLGAQAEVISIGSPYFRIIMTGFLFSSVNFSLNAALRGAGETRSPMRINLVANFFNVIGNAVLIYGLFGFPALGITGAGLSTAASNILAFILLLVHITSGKSQIRISLRNKFRFSKQTIGNLIRIGVPASGEQLVMRVGIMIFVRIVAGLGTTVFAAHQIALSVLALSFNPGMAFGIAAASLVGFSLGKGSPDMAEKYSRSARRMGSVISTSIAIAFFVFAPQLASLFNKDPEVIRNAVLALRIIALIQPFQSSQLILAGAMRGAGDTLWTMIATIVSVLIIRIGLGILFVDMLGWGITGAWSAVLADQLIRWAIIYIRFNSGKWKHIKIR